MATQPIPDDLKFGILVLVQDPNASALPLEHTTVSGQIIGPVASVTVTQRFGNPFKKPIELEYLFPLPHEAAIVDYEISIGNRTIRAEMKELKAAREAYRDAVDAGQRASLLEQRRPNLFSIQIGNVQPGEAILTSLRYQERLRYSDDSYTFVFPMGVTPKYHANLAESPKVDSPIAGDSERIGDVELTLEVDAGTLAGEPTSPSHKFALSRVGEHRFRVSLEKGVMPNKDFVLRYPVATEAVRSAVWISQGDDADTALVTVVPPRLSGEMEPAPREFVFVLDRSGSMSGEPIKQARNALRACLRALGAKDTFYIEAFDNSFEWFDKKAQPVTQEAVQRADEWLQRVEGRGGTEIVPAIESALALPADSERQRYVVFLTDGAVSAEDEALARIKKQRGSARIFTFGIGPSVNRALLAKMAEHGRGMVEFLQLTQDIEDAVTRFQDRVSYPVLLDIQLEWDGAQVWDTYPAHLPDLYVGQPLELTTRLKPTGPATLKLTGQRQNKAVSISIPIPTTSTPDPAIKHVWARARVDALLNDMNADANRQQIIALALEHRLLTPYTAFVAVDSEIANSSGESARHVRVSVPLPEGLDITGFTGGPVRGITMGGLMLHKMAAPMAAMPPSPSPAASPDGGLFDKAANFFAPASGPKRAMQAARPPATAAGASAEEAVPDTIPGRIKWLARTQNVSGSWGSGGDEVEMTAAALLAFVRAGHTTRTGNYRRQVRKAADWLKAAKATGFAAFARQRALSELEEAEQHAEAFVTEALRVGNPTTGPERAAQGDPSIAAPSSVTTLNDLRIAALVAGEASAPPELLRGDQGQLAQAWLAVGRRMS